MKYNIGEKIGNLTIIEFSYIRKNKRYVLCKCDCGVITKPKNIYTLNGNSSCNLGKCSKSFKNRIGERFGKLKIIEFSHMSGDISYWICKCDCNKITHPISITCLFQGLTKTCGSGNCNGKIVNLIGQKFNKLHVIKFSHSQSFKSGVSISYWICKCDCGNITNPVQATHLKSGNIKACGCCKLTSESMLYENLLKIMNKKKYKIERHYKADWLGRQHLDIIILNDNKIVCAIEYDGEQHFLKIEHWGGNDKLQYQKQLDDDKNKKLTKRNIPLIRFSYNDKNKCGNIPNEIIIAKLEPYIDLKGETNNVN